ncbi:unnamed protein product [Effrenium voratum]|uniref:Uncharacterized protein n=1 Tax=Effrenium voratum TaxID=2562239 RepID=A0AA36HRF7_9DINO|nr:unnamed protein product [Effrenium voratum]
MKSATLSPSHRGSHMPAPGAKRVASGHTRTSDGFGWESEAGLRSRTSEPSFGLNLACAILRKNTRADLRRSCLWEVANLGFRTKGLSHLRERALRRGRGNRALVSWGCLRSRCSQIMSVSRSGYVSGKVKQKTWAGHNP